MHSRNMRVRVRVRLDYLCISIRLYIMCLKKRKTTTNKQQKSPTSLVGAIREDLSLWLHKSSRHMYHEGQNCLSYSGLQRSGVSPCFNKGRPPSARLGIRSRPVCSEVIVLTSKFTQEKTNNFMLHRMDFFLHFNVHYFETIPTFTSSLKANLFFVNWHVMRPFIHILILEKNIFIFSFYCVSQ